MSAFVFEPSENTKFTYEVYTSISFFPENIKTKILFLFLNNFKLIKNSWDFFNN